MTFDGRPADDQPANTVFIGDVAIVWGSVNVTGAALASGSAYWQSGVATAFPAGVFASAPSVTVTSKGDTTVPITFGTRVVSTTGFTWRAGWDDETAHSGPGNADFIAIGPRA